jgi:hypothetical protein
MAKIMRCGGSGKRKKASMRCHKCGELGPLLHIVPFCEGPNRKPEGFAKQK